MSKKPKVDNKLPENTNTETETVTEEKDTEKLEVRTFTEEEQKLQRDLNTYYRDYFKVNQLWEFIDPKQFATREFGFDRMDIGFTRNKSFEQPEHLIEYLSLFPVVGVYIGALYKDRVMPSIRYNPATTIHQTKWLGRELIFDLDMDEYDQVRTCKCKGRDTCEICWHLMQEAADIMDETLRVDFGFTKLKWVYTGGRGYHCWVLDEKGFNLTQNQRSAIIGHMQLIHDPKGNQRVDKIGDHAILLKNRIYKKIARNFILNETQKLLMEEAGFTRTTLLAARTKLEVSAILEDIVDVIPKDKEEKFLEALIRRHYPRIDHKVTIDTRRLIRMPGSVHIRSKNISQIIDDPTGFNPQNDAVNLYDILST